MRFLDRLLRRPDPRDLVHAEEKRRVSEIFSGLLARARAGETTSDADLATAGDAAKALYTAPAERHGTGSLSSFPEEDRADYYVRREQPPSPNGRTARSVAS